MKTLIVLAHPDLQQSNVNKAWKEELVKHPNDIMIHELYKEYPDWDIDIDKEHQLLERYDYIIFQFPFYWYNYPPLLKKWFDDVFTYGWAYGSKGDKMKGKKLGLAISIGDKEENYSSTGSVGFTVNEAITPFKATAAHIGAKVLPFFSVYSASFHISREEIEQSAKDYIEYIFQA